MAKPNFIAKAREEGEHAAAVWLYKAMKLAHDKQAPPLPDCPWPINSPEGRAWRDSWNGVVCGAGFDEEAER